MRVPLSALPALMIILFFQASSHYRLFAVPMQNRLHLADLLGLVAPLVAAQQGVTLVGFYHVQIAALVMGFSMLFAARRLSVLIIFCLGIVLASCQSLLGVSPIIWLSFPVLCCSIIIGAGLQGLCSAGFADRRWVLMAAVIMVVLSLTTLLLATRYYNIFAGFGSKYARLLVETAKMYILGAIAVAILYFMARAKLRVHWLRWVVLGLATAVDIFFSARLIVDKIF